MISGHHHPALTQPSTQLLTCAPSSQHELFIYSPVASPVLEQVGIPGKAKSLANSMGQERCQKWLLNKAQVTLLWLHKAAGGGLINNLINPRQLMYPAGLNAPDLPGISLQSCGFLLCVLHVDLGLQAQQNPQPCLFQFHWGSL